MFVTVLRLRLRVADSGPLCSRTNVDWKADPGRDHHSGEQHRDYSYSNISGGLERTVRVLPSFPFRKYFA